MTTIRIQGYHREVRIKVALAKIARWAGRPYFVCPDCCTFTSHSDDVQNSYCPTCHEFKFDNPTQIKCFEPTCPDFGDPSFGEGTCPAEHATPPARRNRT